MIMSITSVGKRLIADSGCLSGMIGFQRALDGGGQCNGYLGRGPVTLLEVTLEAGNGID